MGARDLIFHMSIGQFKLTHPSLLKKGQQLKCIFCDRTFTLYHIFWSVQAHFTREAYFLITYSLCEAILQRLIYWHFAVFAGVWFLQQNLKMLTINIFYIYLIFMSVGWEIVPVSRTLTALARKSMFHLFSMKSWLVRASKF